MRGRRAAVMATMRVMAAAPRRTARPPAAAAAVAVALLAGACGSPRAGGAPGADGARPGVPAAVQRLVAAGGAPGAAALSRDGQRVWFGTAGVADLSSDRRIRAADRFRAGSITKTFVATVVLQLAGEGSLDLADTVDAHLPGLIRGNGNDGRRITVRQLLGHTSGLFNYTEDAGFEESSGSGLRAHRPGTRTPEQLVRVALRHAPSFRPGGGYRYSNTGYILLGLIVEKVTGRPYADEIQRRILRPLGLTGTSFPGTRVSLPPPHGRGYSAASSDVTSLDPSSAGAAGEAVSTLGDLSRFFGALLGGTLLPPGQLREMRDTSGAGGAYGLGLFPVRLPCGVTLWGHNGTISGSYVQTLGTRDGGHVLTFRVNTDAVPAAQAQNRLLKAEFCPTGQQ
jgi:D-alanyl-D-alanine carboxypeptidase